MVMDIVFWKLFSVFLKMVPQEVELLYNGHGYCLLESFFCSLLKTGVSRVEQATM